MIGRLTGRVLEEAVDGTALVDVGGVGYEVIVPLGTIGRVQADPAGLVTLFVHTHVREDALVLFGFASRDERAAFRTLIGVSGVGPKIGVSILGAMTAGELAAAIARRESSRLKAVPGVGKKIADRLVLELKDKLIVSEPVLAGTSKAAPSRSADPKADLLHGALTRLGFRPSEADRAVTSLGDRVQTEPLGDLVREALGLLAR